MGHVRAAVVEGRRLRILYEPSDSESRWRTIDPIGVVTVRGVGYLLAIRDGADRTYRLSRIRGVESLDEPAVRPHDDDLERLWSQRRAQFLNDDSIEVTVRVHPDSRSRLLDTVEVVFAEQADPDGWARLDVAFQDARHAEWAVWQHGSLAEVISPESMRETFRERAAALVARYTGDTEGPVV